MCKRASLPAARLRGISVATGPGAEEEGRASTDETKLILFALGSQATQGTQQAAAARGECKQLGWFGGGGADAVETAKLTTWKNLGNLDKFEAMRLCVPCLPTSHLRPLASALEPPQLTLSRLIPIGTFQPVCEREFSLCTSHGCPIAASRALRPHPGNEGASPRIRVWVGRAFRSIRFGRVATAFCPYRHC